MQSLDTSTHQTVICSLIHVISSRVLKRSVCNSLQTVLQWNRTTCFDIDNSYDMRRRFSASKSQISLRSSTHTNHLASRDRVSRASNPFSQTISPKAQDEHVSTALKLISCEEYATSLERAQSCSSALLPR